MTRRATTGAVARAVLALAVVVAAAGAAGQGWHQILHEPLPAVLGASGRTDMAIAAADGRAGSLPQAIETAAGRIDQPPPAQPGQNLALYQPQPPRTAGPDRRTGGDLDLHYQMVFDPEVVPFKRESSLDEVAADLTMRASGRGLAVQAVGRPARAGHELFWGHVQLRLVPGTPVTLPSVAPTAQVLSWQALPEVALQLWRDDAGNFSVVSPHEGIVELRFLMDAPSGYFAAPLGVGTGRDDPPQPPLPASVRTAAMALWPALGVSALSERGAAISRLVAYFRAFAPGEPPPDTGQALADLVLSQKGVCRHRALGFVIVARSLGIGAHYVSNDAHAFAEVWAPGTDGHGAWQRIDLGGGADSLELHDAQGKHLHQPLHKDPFPQPAAYLNATGQIKVDGAAPDLGWAGAAKLKGADGLKAATNGSNGSVQPGQGPSEGAAGANAAAGSGGGARPMGVAEARRLWLKERAAALTQPAAPQPGAPPSATAAPTATQARTRLHLNPLQPMAWLGEPLAVAGQLQCEQAAVGQLAVEIWLIDPMVPGDGQLLGVVPTDAKGQFAAQLNLPADGDPHVYDVIARFSGDALRHAADSGP